LFVRDQQSRPRGQRHGNHRALPQASGKLVRELLRAGLGFGDRRAPQRIDRLAFHFFGAKLWLMRANRFFDLRADAHHGFSEVMGS